MMDDTVCTYFCSSVPVFILYTSTHFLAQIRFSCDFCIVNHYLDAYSAIPPALRADPTKPDSVSSRNGRRGTESMEVMCMFDARDEERANRCKEVTRNAQKQVRRRREVQWRSNLSAENVLQFLF